MEQSSEKLQKEAYVILSKKKKKKRQKIRGREFRLITVTEGMMPIGM